MKAVFIVLALAVASVTALSNVDAQQQFIEFSQRFNKKYEVGEVFKRLAIFKDNVEYINQQNSENNTYTLGVNEFSDLSHEEFVSMYVGKLPAASNHIAPMLDTTGVPIANDVDWRSRAVTPVQNQGQCGSCWTFSATGAAEGAAGAAGKSLIKLSEQQLLDCSGAMGNLGCNGGYPGRAMDWAARNGGSCSAASYSYKGVQGTCQSCTPAQNIVKSSSGVSPSDAGLVAALNLRPVSVAIEAAGRAFQSYRSGVFTGPCGQNIDHAVLAVGYDSQSYIVKNSWGSSWGNGGYIWMSRSVANICGIQRQMYVANI